MKKFAYIVLVLVLFAILGVAVHTWSARQPVVEGELTPETLSQMEIAPVEQALTFAKTISGQVMLVVGMEGSTSVHGIELKRADGSKFVDGIEAYHELGEAHLQQMASGTQYRVFSWSDLAVPIDQRFPHIAAGTNYRAHAEEVGMDGTPFLFPKLVDSTPWNANVVIGARMDYEVEVCVTPIADYSLEDKPQLAYLLCNDFTDRMALVTNIDTSAAMGTTGFSIGKGGATWLPVGALLVIPRNGNFYEDIEVELYVNDELRQSAMARLMVWTPEEIMDNAIADCERDYHVAEGSVRLTSCDKIAARTLVLTGTPEGVLFRLSSVWNPFVYLQAGDTVVASGSYLGFLKNKLTISGEGG